MKSIRSNIVVAFFLGHLLIADAQTHPVDEILERANRSKSTSQGSVEGSVYSDLEKGESELRSKVMEGDRKAEERNARMNEYEASKESRQSNTPSSTRPNTSQKRAEDSSRLSDSSRTERVRTFWHIKNEMQQVIAVCGGSKREIAYTFHPKTSRYCTPMSSCSEDEGWVQRALCR